MQEKPGQKLNSCWEEMDQSSNKDKSHVFLQFKPSGNVLLCFPITKGPCTHFISSVPMPPREKITRNIPNLSLTGHLINCQEGRTLFLLLSMKYTGVWGSSKKCMSPPTSHLPFLFWKEIGEWTFCSSLKWEKELESRNHTALPSKLP